MWETLGHVFFNLFKVAVDRNLSKNNKGSKTTKRKLKMDSPTSAAAPSNVFVLSPTTYGRVCLCFIRAKVCQHLQLVCRKSQIMLKDFSFLFFCTVTSNNHVAYTGFK